MHGDQTHKTLYGLQAARGVAALMVVVFHAFDLDAKFILPNVMPGIAEYGQLGVDIFFVISGFVMAMTTGRAHSDPAKIGNFVYKRLTRIYPIYWVYFLMLVPVVLYMPGMVNSSQSTGPDFFRSFFLLPDNRVPLLLVSWSLVYELWFYAVFAVILLFPRPALPYLLLGWAAVLLIFSGIAFQSPFLRVVTGSYGLEFILGALAYLASRRLPRVKGDAALCFGLMLMGGCAVVWPTIFDDKTPLRMLAFGFPTALALFGLVQFERSGRFPKCAFVEMAGDISYSLYLSHLLVLSATCRFGTMIFGHDLISPLVAGGFWCVAILATLVWAYISYRWIEGPLMKATRSIAPKRRLAVT
ncbi:MAG: acyltransferase [Rhizobiales bacterium]|nr:acyltransferase [Hyphomicrobiales bacterium]OJY06687.1 MAG: hypothetical protein BGP07_16735 [Rhizobiales bacterium 63-22]